MKISISNLSEGVHEYHFTAEPALLGLADNFANEFAVHVTLDKSGRELLLKARASVPGKFVCDRCVDPFDRQIEAAYQIVYVYDDRDRGKYSDDEVQVIHSGTTAIDLDDDLRQYLLLAVPLKLLCQDSCRGLCPHCGTNWNRSRCSCQSEEIDPRWQVLKKRFSN